jgi:seryl-tRNA synthetase
MINDESFVKIKTDEYKKRMVKNCNFADALPARETVTQRKVQLEAKIKEYSERRDALLEKDKTLGTEIAAAISEGKKPSSLSEARRKISDEISDLNTWIDESEKLLVTVQADELKATEKVHQAILIAAGEDNVLVINELNAELKKVEDRIEAWHLACQQLQTDYGIASVDRNIGLTNRHLKHCL